MALLKNPLWYVFVHFWFSAFFYPADSPSADRLWPGLYSKTRKQLWRV